MSRSRVEALQPAEWSPHRAVWMAWPHLAREWGAHLEGARAATVALAREIAADGAGERVEMLVPRGIDAAARDRAEGALGTGVRLHEARYGDTWLRDTAPIFVRRGAELAAARFRFNGWGEKYDFPGDREVGDEIAALAGRPVEPHDFVLEGGAVEVDGEGTLLTTRQCLQNPNRNPGLGQADIEARLASALGARRVIWLDEGLAGDHTDGHIDTLARFVAPGRVVCMVPGDAGDPNAAVLRDIERTLRGARDAAGRALEVVALPSPGRIECRGELLAASYTNFYIGNRAVVVPTYGSAADGAAVDLLASLFPDRRVVGLDAYAVMTGGGAFHCITQQEPT